MIERNSIIQRYRTFSEMLAELKARLGFVSQGPASMTNNVLLESILKEAHSYVYAQLNPNPMRKKTVISLEKGSYLYDWHNDIEDEDIDPGLAKSLWLIDESGARYPLVQGISEYHREDSTRGRPTRYGRECVDRFLGVSNLSPVLVACQCRKLLILNDIKIS